MSFVTNHLINSHGISFASHKNWTTTPISITKLWNEDGADIEQKIDVQNVYSLANIKEILADHEAKKLSNRSYLDSLTTHNNKDFPNLVFCTCALRNLHSSAVSTIDFPRIIDALKKLDSAICVSSNQNELIENSGLNISGESQG